ncbi:MAG: lytic murein transglycosylase B [Woeseia sp.]
MIKLTSRAGRTGLACLIFMYASPAFVIDVERPDVRQFVATMVSKHSYDREYLISVLDSAEVNPAILEAISKPAEKMLSWGDYRQIFLTRERIDAGADFWKEHADDLRRISTETGVPCDILVAIIGVETYFGRITGKHRVLDALTTLAFDYPPRSAFFLRELEEFLLLVREEQMTPTDATGSYAGAMGAPQFMPSSFRAYAVDANADGKRDIWSDWQDVIGSIANYFVAHKWTSGRPVAVSAALGAKWQGPVPDNTLSANETVASLKDMGVQFATDLAGDQKGQLLTFDGKDGDEHWVGFQNFFVITRYNHSPMYALSVYQLGQEIAAEVAHRNLDSTVGVAGASAATE